MTLYIDMASRCGIVTIIHDECTSNLGERPMDSGQIQKLEFFLTSRYPTNHQDSTLEASSAESSRLGGRRMHSVSRARTIWVQAFFSDSFYFCWKGMVICH